MEVINRRQLILTSLSLTLLAIILTPHALAHSGHNTMERRGKWRSTSSTPAASLQNTHLTPNEQEGLIYMRQEEKLARDVYLTLYDKWQLPVFKNIAQSEEKHTQSVKSLIDQAGLEDPITDDSRGAFKDQVFIDLYQSLVEKGSQSEVDALKVGATIEDLDIKDLQERLEDTQNQAIVTVYDNLMAGSENHMRAFVSQLKSRGADYTPQYISQEDFEAILTGENGRGRGLQQGSHQTETVTLQEMEARMRRGQAGWDTADTKTQTKIIQQLRERFQLKDTDVVSLSPENGELKVQVKKQVKLLGLLKLQVPVEIEFDQNGEIKSIDKPWWAFWIKL